MSAIPPIIANAPKRTSGFKSLLAGMGTPASPVKRHPELAPVATKNCPHDDVIVSA
jgi:hypothetical protein